MKSASLLQIICDIVVRLKTPTHIYNLFDRKFNVMIGFKLYLARVTEFKLGSKENVNLNIFVLFGAIT